MRDHGLSEEQRMMRDSCRAFVNDFVTPFIRQNWQREWSMDPEDAAAAGILEEADTIGIRTLGVPEEFGGVALDQAHEVQTFALISEEIARGDSGPFRQAGADLEGLGAAAQRRAAPPAGTVVPAHREGPAVPARALPHRAARGLRPLAALQRARGGDADARGAEGRRVGDQRAQAVHQQRLRREPLRRLRQHQPQGRHAAGHFQLPRAARHPGPHHRALQRDARRPLHEQRRAGVRGHALAGATICSSRTTRSARPASISSPARSSRPRRISASACAPSSAPPTTCRTTCRADAS